MRCLSAKGSNDEFGFASYLIRVRLDVNLADPNYLKFFLNSTHGRDEIDRRRRTSAGQFNVNSENLRSITFPCPPKETQLAVIEQLAEQESRLVQLQAEIASAQAIESGLREAILRKAFAGEL
jgi:type I restriction enzyme S subunit